ncbi:MAG: helix-turn-helix transcriptional regulator [Bifidobacterium longum]|nr:helix-turn-helix transcriptional regulator [Bifidobacterium longum]
MVLVCTSDVISGRLRELMRQQHITQRSLASEIGLSFQLLNAKLHGRANYTSRDLVRIADYFDVSLDYLTGRSNYTKPLEVVS